MPRLRIKDLETFSKAQGISLYIWYVSETEEELAALLSSEIFRFADAQSRFTSSSRRCEWLATRVLLAGEAQLCSDIVYDAQGRPSLSAFPDKHISISHSRGYVALAIAPFPLGIDIEVDAARAHRLRSKFLSESELQLIPQIAARYAEVDESRAAVMLWSGKEAFYKKDESQTLVALSDIELTLSHDTLKARNKPQDCAPLSTLSFLLTPDFVLALCR